MRIRTVKPEFWESESNGKLPLAARLLFIGLWNLCDDYGRCRGAAQYIAGALFPYDQDAVTLTEDSLRALEEHGKIVRYEVNGSRYIEVPQFSEHQVINRKSNPKYPNTHGVIPEPSLSTHSRKGREGNGKEGIEGREGATQSDVPDKHQAVAQTAVAGIDAEFAAKVFDYWADRGGKDASGFSIPWLKYVKRRWENERREWIDGTHQWRRGTNGGNRQKSNPTNI